MILDGHQATVQIDMLSLWKNRVRIELIPSMVYQNFKILQNLILKRPNTSNLNHKLIWDLMIYLWVLKRKGIWKIIKRLWKTRISDTLAKLNSITLIQKKLQFLPFIKLRQAEPQVLKYVVSCDLTQFIKQWKITT